MYEDSAREGRIIATVAAQIHQDVWASVDPILCQSTSPDVPPQAHEGMTLRTIGPKAFREVFWPSSGPRDICPPHQSTQQHVLCHTRPVALRPTQESYSDLLVITELFVSNN
jgi:hypothetical protein